MSIKMQRVQFVLFLIVVLSMAGCQAGPVLPDIQPSNDPAAQTASRSCLGFYMLLIDSEKLTVEVVPVRAAALHLNVVGILNTTMGVSAIGVPAEADPANGLFVFDVTLTHPFAIKPQLAGFDVKGILMTPGTLELGSQIFADVDETQLENADGYTRWWNPTEFTDPGMFGYTHGTLANAAGSQLTATINPYKYFADILSAEDVMTPVYAEPLDSDNGRGVFKAGSLNTRRYRIRFPMDPGPQIVYGYAVDAAWAAPDVNPPNEVPDDFPINANQPEAFYIALGQKANSMYYDTESGMSGGVLRLQANVHDWQGMDSGDIQGEIVNVLVYCPELWSGGAFMDLLDETAYNARFTLDLSDLATPAAAGNEILMVRAASLGPEEYDQGLGAAPQESPLGAWRAQPITITDPSCEPDSNNSQLEAEEIGISGQVTAELCDVVDMEDWYWFEIPAGYEVTGEIRWYSDADICESALVDESGDYIVGSYHIPPGLHVIDLTDRFLPPGKFFIQANAQQVMSPPPGALVYLLETDLELNNVEPFNPTDITPDTLDCSPTWVGTDPGYDSTTVMTGNAGTWGAHTDSLGILLQSRTFDGFGSEPGFYYPCLYIWDYPGGGTVDLLDYSDIHTPVKHEAVLTLTDPIEAMTMSSTHLYIAVDDGTNSYIRVYDYASDPANPAYVGGVQIIHDVIQLELIDPEGPNTMLVAMAGTVMRLYDVEDPTFIIGADSEILMDGTNLSLAVGDNYIIKTYVDTMLSRHLSVFKWNGVSGLEFWGHVALPGYGEYVAAKGVYAYVGDGDIGITVINFQNKNALSIAAMVPTSSRSRYIHVTDSFLLNCQDGAGLVVYDITSPSSPLEVDDVKCLNNPYDVEVKYPYALFVEGVRGYGTITPVVLTDPSGPSIPSEFQLEYSAHEITSWGDYVAVGSSEAGKIWIYEFSTNPVQFSEVYEDTFPGFITAMEMTNEGLYVSLSTGVMQVYDTSLAPVIFKKPDYPLAGGDPVSDFAFNLSANYAYTTQYLNPVFSIYDISDPFNWSLIQSGNTTYIAQTADIYNDFLYIMTSDEMFIYSLDPDPSTPQLISHPVMPDPGNMVFVDVEGQYAYVSDQGDPVQVVSVYPPDSPQITGFEFPSAGGSLTTGISVYDNLLFIMKLGCGVRMYELY